MTAVTGEPPPGRAAGTTAAAAPAATCANHFAAPAAGSNGLTTSPLSTGGLQTSFQPHLPAAGAAAPAAAVGAVPLSNIPAQSTPRGPLDLACDLNPRPNPLIPGSTAALFGAATGGGLGSIGLGSTELGGTSVQPSATAVQAAPAGVMAHSLQRLPHLKPTGQFVTTEMLLGRTAATAGGLSLPISCDASLGSASYAMHYEDFPTAAAPTQLQLHQQQYQLASSHQLQQPLSPSFGSMWPAWDAAVPAAGSLPLQGMFPQQYQGLGGPVMIRREYVTTPVAMVPLQTGSSISSATAAAHVQQISSTSPRPVREGAPQLTAQAMNAAAGWMQQHQQFVQLGGPAYAQLQAVSAAIPVSMFAALEPLGPAQAEALLQQQLAAVPPSMLAETAAVPGGQPEIQCEIGPASAAPEGPFISLLEFAAPGREGLFAVTRARAERAVPLEAADVDSKRDRAATARRALAQKGTKPTSAFRGVTHHVRTGRWEAHIWLEGKQVYLGGFDSEPEAAMAYDMAAVKFRGRSAQTNFSLTNYEEELATSHQVRGDDLVAALRRQSRGPASTSSSFRGVTKHAKGRWEARIGRGAGGPAAGGRKYTYLGLYDTEIEAAMAYDRAAVKLKGLAAITNFDLSMYLEELNPEELQQYINSGHCPPEALEAAAMAADAAAAAVAAAAASAGGAEDAPAPAASAAGSDGSQSPEPSDQYMNRRGQPTRRAAAAASAAWADALVSPEDKQATATAVADAADDEVTADGHDALKTPDWAPRCISTSPSTAPAVVAATKDVSAAGADQNSTQAAGRGRGRGRNRGRGRGSNAANAAASEAKNVHVPGGRPTRSRAGRAAAPLSSAAAAAGQALPAVTAKTGSSSSSGVQGSAGQRPRAGGSAGGRVITTAVAAHAAAAAAGTQVDEIAATMMEIDVDEELRKEQRQYQEQLLDQEQQQQQERMHQAAAAAAAAARADRAGARAAAAESFASGGAGGAAVHAVAPARPLRRTHTAPPVSAQFLSELSLDFMHRDQAGVHDFVLPDEEQDGAAAVPTAPGTAAGAGTSKAPAKGTNAASAAAAEAEMGQLLTVDCFNYSDDDTTSDDDSSSDVSMQELHQGLGFDRGQIAAGPITPSGAPGMLEGRGMVEWVEAELRVAGLVDSRSLGHGVNPALWSGPLGRSVSDVSALQSFNRMTNAVPGAPGTLAAPAMVAVSPVHGIAPGAPAAAIMAGAPGMSHAGWQQLQQGSLRLVNHGQEFIRPSELVHNSMRPDGQAGSSAVGAAEGAEGASQGAAQINLAAAGAAAAEMHGMFAHDDARLGATGGSLPPVTITAMPAVLQSPAALRPIRTVPDSQAGSLQGVAAAGTQPGDAASDADGVARSASAAANDMMAAAGMPVASVGGGSGGTAVAGAPGGSVFRLDSHEANNAEAVSAGRSQHTLPPEHDSAAGVAAVSSGVEVPRSSEAVRAATKQGPLPPKKRQRLGEGPEPLKQAAALPTAAAPILAEAAAAAGSTGAAAGQQG